MPEGSNCPLGDFLCPFPASGGQKRPPARPLTSVVSSPPFHRLEDFGGHSLFEQSSKITCRPPKNRKSSGGVLNPPCVLYMRSFGLEDTFLYEWSSELSLSSQKPALHSAGDGSLPVLVLKDIHNYGHHEASVSCTIAISAQFRRMCLSANKCFPMYDVFAVV